MKKGNILITGASSGIGKYCAAKFLEEDYRVFGTMRSPEDAEKLEQELGSSFQSVLLDVTSSFSIAEAFRKVSRILGGEGLDLLINNAGVAISAPTTIIGLDEYRYQFEVNLFGVIAVTKAFLPMLGADITQKISPGKIFNISSVSGKLVYPFLGPYCSSKFALEGYSHALRRELLLYDIKVVIIAPGPIKTAIWEKSTRLSEEILASDYGLMAERLSKMVLKRSESAMPAEKFAEKLYNIFLKKNPAVRYTITHNRLTRWIIPRYFISDRLLDRIIKKMLKM
jgi:NAD(P)-dependent dehydrogenase (short-subunit alcohol dehydrogenase family)